VSDSNITHLPSSEQKGRTILTFDKMDPPTPEMDVKWNSKLHLYKIRSFLRRFLHFGNLAKSANMSQKFSFKKSIRALQNAKFYADFEFIEMQ